MVSSRIRIVTRSAISISSAATFAATTVVAGVTLQQTASVPRASSTGQQMISVGTVSSRRGTGDSADSRIVKIVRSVRNADMTEMSVSMMSAVTRAHNTLEIMSL